MTTAAAGEGKSLSRERERAGVSPALESRGREVRASKSSRTGASWYDDSISTKVDWLLCDPKAGSPRMAHGQEPTESGQKGTRVRVHKTSRDVRQGRKQTGRVQGHTYRVCGWKYGSNMVALKALRILSHSFAGKRRKLSSRVGRRA